MPTSTFFNLPPPKRERLLRAAAAEFAQKPFDQVSINRIIRAAEIPRGSFYQYFFDKTDLFHYILACFGRQMEAAVLNSLDACGGDLLAVPLTLFDQVLACIREHQESQSEFHVFVSIVRQNTGMDASQLWELLGTARTVLERADLSGLNAAGEERAALLDLLLSSAAQALMAVSCGRLPPEESRRRLAAKMEIIRRGAGPNGGRRNS